MKWLIVSLICLTFLLAPFSVSLAQSDSVPNSVLCSCVRTARWLGVDVPMVDATYFQSFKHQTPARNGLVLLSYKSGLDHVAVIKDFQEDGLLVVEGNYKPCQMTTRLIKWSDPNLRGFWSPS